MSNQAAPKLPETRQFLFCAVATPIKKQMLLSIPRNVFLDWHKTRTKKGRSVRLVNTGG